MKIWVYDTFRKQIWSFNKLWVVFSQFTSNIKLIKSACIKHDFYNLCMWGKNFELRVLVLDLCMYLLSDISIEQWSCIVNLLYTNITICSCYIRLKIHKFGLKTIPIFSFSNSSVKWWLSPIWNDKMKTKIISIKFAFTYRINRPVLLCKSMPYRN